MFKALIKFLKNKPLNPLLQLNWRRTLKVNRLKARPGRFREILLLSAVLLAWGVSAYAKTVDLSGQASAWVTVRSDDTQVGLRYIPELSYARQLWETYEISAEAAAKIQWFSRYDDEWDRIEKDSDVDSYRLWVRFASSQYEARAGLQKISFGSATLLRPLMWFDSIDPRDPLQLTDGVYGVLGRYYFLNNANIWVWGLYGNDDLKGWETIPSYEREIEFGGRVQMPVPAGEMGLSYHHRRVNPKGSVFGARYPDQGKFPEQRIGLDGKWDIGVGLWLEGTVTRQDLDVPAPRYQKLFTVGTDYTFDIGNGPHLLLEQFVGVDTKNLFGSGDSQSISALLADYPLSLLDTVSAIVYYDWEIDNWSGFLTWRRSYDQWQIHLSAFRNPDRDTITQDGTTGSSFSGNGVQLMLVFNH
jgi:hypothetical protein